MPEPPIMMDPALQQEILQMYKLSLSWDQAFCVTHYDQSVKMPNSCSEIGLHPLHPTDQPIKIPCGLNYPFDKILMGATSCHSLKKMIKEFLPESDFVSCREFPKVSSNAHGYILCCHHCKPKTPLHFPYTRV